MKESEMREGKEKERKGWKKRKQDQRGSAEARECPVTRGLGILWQKSEDKQRKRREKKKKKEEEEEENTNESTSCLLLLSGTMVVRLFSDLQPFPCFRRGSSHCMRQSFKYHIHIHHCTLLGSFPTPPEEKEKKKN